MKRKVKSYIESNGLIATKAKHLVALSGGADSVALLCCLLELGYDVEAVHCNFHLRGDESNRDEDFCRLLCQKYDVKLHVAHFDTVSYAFVHKVSIEMAARDLRYNYFNQLLEDTPSVDVCVAHHKDDQVETILLNMLRGTGLNGLSGMKASSGKIIRPLLCVSRDEITDYLNSIGQEYITDSTNLCDDVKRNKLRLNVIPLLKEMNPSLSDTMCKMAGDVAEATAFAREGLDLWREKVCRVPEDDNEVSIWLDACKDAPSPEALLFDILRGYGFNASTVRDIAMRIDSQSGKHWLSQDYIAIVENECLNVRRQQELVSDITIPETGRYVLSNGDVISVSVEDFNESFELKKSSDIAMLDASKVVWPLCLRHAQTADRFTPFGMRGSKLISDFLTDRKMAFDRRKHQLLLCDHSGNVMWVVNKRADNRYRITGKTIKALVVRYIIKMG